MMKYIKIVNWKEDKGLRGVVVAPEEQIIVFPKDITHKVMADTLKKTHSELKVISAGFVRYSIDDNGINKAICYGMSESLNIESDSKLDTMLLTGELKRST